MSVAREEGVVCKKCGGQDIEYIKTWTATSPKTGITIMIELWNCRVCRKSFRIFWRKDEDT